MKEAENNLVGAVRRIESPSNPLWKELRKAARAGERFRGAYWITETTRLFEEAIRSGCAIDAVFSTKENAAELRRQYSHLAAEVWVEVSARAMAAAPGTETAQGIVALVRCPHYGADEIFTERAMLVVLDRLQDPGNAGTILRAAEAFGATGALFLAGSASPDSGKVLRASAGSLFRLPFLTGVTPEGLMAQCKRRGIALYAADPEAKTAVEEVAWRFPGALVIGNEGAGISDEILRHAMGFRIPTVGVESLNAALSAGIALYTMGRSRGGGSGGAHGTERAR